MWKAWIEWEKTNPLLLESDDAVYKRVMYAFKQAVMNMRFYPEIWYFLHLSCVLCPRYSAAEYAKSKGKDAEAADFMKNGIKGNKLSFLLHFQYVEHEEENHHVSKFQATLESLINNISQEFEKMNKMAEFMKLQLDAENESDLKLLSELPEDEREPILDRQRNRKQQKEGIDRDHEMRVERISNDATTAWITLMHAMRRAEGIKSARQVFAKARKAKPLSHLIFVASALMEYYNNGDKAIATKVFELGLRTYHDKSDYVLHYLDFLLQINDEASSVHIQRGFADLQMRGRYLSGLYKSYLHRRRSPYMRGFTNTKLSMAT